MLDSTLDPVSGVCVLGKLRLQGGGCWWNSFCLSVSSKTEPEMTSPESFLTFWRAFFSLSIYQLSTGCFAHSGEWGEVGVSSSLRAF